MTFPRVYRHTSFRGDRAIRWDTKRTRRWGWYYAVGWRKPSVPVYVWSAAYRFTDDGRRRKDHLNCLGGMSWQRIGRTDLFLCRYRAR